MDCKQAKELLYELVAGKLEGDASIAIEKHLRECQSCRQARERLTLTLNALDTVKPPHLSPGFQTEVLKRAQDIPLPSKPLWHRFREWFQVPYIKWPLEGLAVTAVILIALTVYKGVSLTKPSKIEMTPRSFQMEFSETTAKHPIIIPTRDLDKTLSSLENLIKKYDGRIIQSLPKDKEIQVTLNLKKENEAAFLTQLKKSGTVQMEQEGFRDEAGDIVVILKAIK